MYPSPDNHVDVTVIIPVYNRQHLIGRALSSLMAQTWQSWHAVVTDDGSTDGTAAIVQELAAIDARITLVSNEHAGAAAARNTALKFARGAWIAFLDSDDEYMPDHLQLRMDYLKDHPELDMIHGGLEIIGDPWVPDVNNPGQRIHIDDCQVGGTFIIRASLLHSLGGFPLVAYGEDTALMEKILDAGLRIGKVPFPTYRYYRDQPDSTCNRLGAEK